MPTNPLQPHSEAKIRLLKAYLDAYLNVIGHDKYTERVFLADLFCGPGMYDDEKPGSPVEIGRMLADLHGRHPGAPRTEFLFNDVDKANVSNVAEYLRPLETAHPKIRLIPKNTNAQNLFRLFSRNRMTKAPNPSVSTLLIRSATHKLPYRKYYPS